MLQLVHKPLLTSLPANDMTDTIEKTDSTETPSNNLKNPTRSASKSHRLPPSAYRELGSSSATASNSGRVSPAMQRARMAVERGREFRSEAAAAIAVPADTTNGYQSDDELILAATSGATRMGDLQTPLPKRPASALAGQMDSTQVVRQSVQPPVVPAQQNQRSEGRELPSDQQRLHQASLDELFAKYPSMQASFKLLPPNKQQEQWSRLFQMLDSQQAAVTAWQSAQHSDQLEQMRSRVRRELSEERLLLDRRLANHSRLTDEAAGSWGASRRGNPARTVPYEARSTNGLIDNRCQSPVKLRDSPVVKSYPRPEQQQAQQKPSGPSNRKPQQEQQLHSNQANFQRLQQYQQQLLQHQPQRTTVTEVTENGAGDEWHSVQLHSQLTEMAKQLAESRREADWLRARMAEVNYRVDELLTENFRLKVRLGDVNNTQGEIQCNSGSRPGQWSPNNNIRSDDSRSPPTTMDRRSRPSTRPAAVETTTSTTVAALRQSLAELERRNLIDRSPTRYPRSRSSQKKAIEKGKSRGLHESSQSPNSRRHHQQSETSPTSSTGPRYGKMRSNGLYTVIRS